MTWVTLVLSIVGGLVSILSTGLISGINTQKKKIDALETDNKTLTEKLAAADDKVKTAVADATGRQDTLIAELKKEIKELEARLADQSSTGDVRSRLGQLFPGG